MLALLEAVFLNPVKKDQKLVDVVAKYDLGASTFYTMRTGILIPWTMQDNCPPSLNSCSLLALERLRRKILIK